MQAGDDIIYMGAEGSPMTGKNLVAWAKQSGAGHVPENWTWHKELINTYMNERLNE